MKLDFLLFAASLLTLGCASQASRNGAAPQGREARPVPEPAQHIKNMREMFLTSPPEKFGFDGSRADYKVYGVLMETGYPEGLATIVSLRDGNASLYLGQGGGIIGGFAHKGVRQSATDFVGESEKHLARMKGTKSFPYPAVGRVKFYLLTFDGVVTTEGDERTLGEGRHELSLLFHKGQDVLTQLRLISEKQD